MEPVQSRGASYAAKLIGSTEIGKGVDIMPLQQLHLLFGYGEGVRLKPVWIRAPLRVGWIPTA
jgi:hypothetical protein